VIVAAWIPGEELGAVFYAASSKRAVRITE